MWTNVGQQFMHMNVGCKHGKMAQQCSLHQKKNKKNVIWATWAMEWGHGAESALWGGQKCCHIILFSKGVHVWTLTMVILEHIFPNFVHNMVDHNTKIHSKINFFFPTYIVWFQSIFVAKKCTSLCNIMPWYINDIKRIPIF